MSSRRCKRKEIDKYLFAIANKPPRAETFLHFLTNRYPECDSPTQLYFLENMREKMEASPYYGEWLDILRRDDVIDLLVDYWVTPE